MQLVKEVEMVATMEVLKEVEDSVLSVSVSTEWSWSVNWSVSVQHWEEFKST